MENVFLQWVVGWAAEKILKVGFSAFRKQLPELVEGIYQSPATQSVDSALLNRYRGLLQTLIQSSSRTFPTVLSDLVRKTERPILVIGPSGTGKSCVLRQLANQDCHNVSKTTREESSRLAGFREKIHVHAYPGDAMHGNAFQPVIGKLTADSPPGLVCMVVAGGYHATAGAEYVGAAGSPNYQRMDARYTPGTLDEFLSCCRREEVDHLTSILKGVSGRVQQRVPWVITIVNKMDLWGTQPEILARYEDESSEYGQVLLRLRRELGGDDPTAHDVFPAYLDDNGFAPNPLTGRLAYTRADLEAHALVLRALVYYRYQGAVATAGSSGA